MIQFVGTLYTLAVIGLAVYGVFGLLTLWLYLRHYQEPTPTAQEPSPEAWPLVTVQLPIFNEPLVVERLIDHAINLDYPRERLQIQVLDDSTDQTAALARASVARHASSGAWIEHLHREKRAGYKAGALQAGLERASGELIAIFDADFLPQRDFLRLTVPHLVNDRGLGMVQTRWGHLNSEFTPLTRAQAISLDKHFAIEQLVRHRANLFPKFNGSGGIWRADCIRAAGGWLADTVCEDLDLSTRAQLDGWRFLFMPDVVSPAELPPQMTAYKIQQARWAKGSLQCFGKYWRTILQSRRHALLARFYALVSMTGYLAHPMMLTLLLLLPPLLYWGYDFSPLLAAASVAGIAQPLLFVLSQQTIYPNWPRRAAAGLPALALIAVGLAPTNTWSIVEALFRRDHVFYRTPKFNLLPGRDGRWVRARLQGFFPTRFNPLILAELSLALYACLGAAIALSHSSLGSLPFLLLCAAGLGYTAITSLLDILR